jgi:Family of unknown function (DUF5719)
VRGVIANRAVQLVVLVVAVAAAAGLAVLRHTVTFAASGPVPRPRAAPVNTVLRACAAPGLAGAPAAQVALIAGPGPSGPGRAVVSPLGVPAGAPLASLTQPGTLSVTTVHPATVPRKKAPPPAPAGQPVATVPAAGGVVIQGSGSMARGLEAEEITAGGKVSARCDAPGTDFWFVGPGAFTASHIQLYLSNVAGQPADVNVAVFTDAGPLQGSTDTGVAVAPHTMVTQSLDKPLHGTRVVALHVRTSVGQVVAALSESTGSSNTQGWLPVSAEPATHMIIPGSPAIAGARELFVAVPGTQDAHITLSAITPKGSYQPTGGSGLDIPGGSVAQVSLPSLAGIPCAIQVSANVPVTASLELPGGQHGTPGAFSAAAAAVQEQGAVAANVTGAGAASSLVLSAPGRDVRVRLTEVGTGGGPAAPGGVLVVTAHHTLVQQLTAPAGTHRGSPFGVVITPLPGSGPLYAARVVTASGRGGAVQAILPVPSALTTVPLPAVQGTLITAGR